MTTSSETLGALRRPSDTERRARILAAAERAFVRHGFHAATMNHVAEEAGMSAGNLYRYFPSKEALVEHLCRSDRDAHMAEFMRLAAGGDLCGALKIMMRDKLLQQRPEQARLALEIWAEAGRNDRVGEVLRAFDATTFDSLREFIVHAKASAQLSADIDPDFAARVIFTLICGLQKRLALEPGLNLQAEAEMAIATLQAVFSGALAPAADPAIEER